MLVIIARKKALENIGIGEDSKNSRTNLIRVLCIQYSIIFWRKSVLLLFNSSNEIKAIYPTFTKKLRLPIRPTNIGILKINGIILNIYGIVVVVFLVINKVN